MGTLFATLHATEHPGRPDASVQIGHDRIPSHTLLTPPSYTSFPFLQARIRRVVDDLRPSLPHGHGLPNGEFSGVALYIFTG